MKYIISERQYRLLTEDEEQKVWDIPNVEIFGGWEGLQVVLRAKNNPFFRIKNDLELNELNIESLGKLVSVDGELHIKNSSISDFGELRNVGKHLRLYAVENLTSLGKLKKVGGKVIIRSNVPDLVDLGDLEEVGDDFAMRALNVSSLGKLKYIGEDLNIDDTNVSDLRDLGYVGGFITLRGTPLSKTTTEKEVRTQTNCRHQIYL